jgi:hypothetical protein
MNASSAPVVTRAGLLADFGYFYFYQRDAHVNGPPV